MIFLFPTPFEADKFVSRHPDAEVVICGVGMAEAAATMARVAVLMAKNEVSKSVILAGIAGSYNLDQLPLNSVVEVVSEQIEEIPDRFRERYESAPRWGLREARSNSVNRSNVESRECEIENMEGASVAAICEELGIEFSQIRAISNGVGDPTSEWHFESAIEALTDALSAIYTNEIDQLTKSPTNKIE